jgi:PAS domain S-box-containing protein
MIDQNLRPIKTSHGIIDQDKKALKNVIDHTTECIFSADRNFNFLSFNKAFIDLFFSLHDRQPMIGESMLSPTAEESRKATIENCNRVFAGESFVIEYKLVVNDQELWFKAAHYPIYENNEITGVAIFSSDITDEKKARADLASQTIFTDQLLNSVPADIALFDLDHKYLFVNPIAIKNPEIRKWLIGKDDFDYCRYRNVDIKLAENRRKLFLQAISTRKDVEWIDEHPNDSGGKSHILRRFHPLIENDKVYRVVGYGIDVSELKGKDAELQKMNAELIRTEETERARFAYELHDGLSQILVSAKLHLGIGRSSNNYNKVEELLNLAVSEAKNISNNIAPKDLKEYGLISAVDKLFERISNTRRLNIKFDFTPEFAQLDMDEHMQFNIYRIIQESLNNTLRHSKATKITTRFSYNHNMVEILFSDNGKGIEEEILEKPVTFIAIKRRLNLLKGRFKVSSKPGKGTSFIYDIPFMEKIFS